MNIFPEFKNITVISESSSDIKSRFKEPLFDFEKSETVIKDGKTIMTTKEQHVQQYISLLVRTQINKYKVYQDTDFGLTDLYEQQGKQFYITPLAIEELKRELKEKCEINPNIELVADIEITSNFNTVNIKMSVQIEGKELIITEVIK